MPTLFRGSRGVKLALAALVLCGLMPVPRDTVAAWTVVVRDSAGRGMEGIVVGQLWYDITFGLQGLEEARTDAEGRLVFPRVRTYRPVLVFMYMAAPSLTNVHRGFGRAADVTVKPDGRLFDQEVSGRRSCGNRGCLDSDLLVVFTLTPTGERQDMPTRRPSR